MVLIRSMEDIYRLAQTRMILKTSNVYFKAVCKCTGRPLLLLQCIVVHPSEACFGSSFCEGTGQENEGGRFDETVRTRK